jgi:hypothetical protein
VDGVFVVARRVWKNKTKVVDFPDIVFMDEILVMFLEPRVQVGLSIPT